GFFRNRLAAVISGWIFVICSNAAFAAAPVPDTDESRIGLLITANHILAEKGILEGFGHVSVRSAANPKHYFIAAAVAPGLVTRNDILEFDENSQPVTDLKGREIYSERFIHGEIYRVRPDVQSVIHSHASDVIPFTLVNVPFKPLIHVAAFLGVDPLPVFDLATAIGENNKMLVNTQESGAPLAKVLGNRSVVLMRRHGMAVTGPDVRWTVFRAIYTEENAKIELEALKLGQPKFMNKYEVDRMDRIDRIWDQWVADAEKKN